MGLIGVARFMCQKGSFFGLKIEGLPGRKGDMIAGLAAFTNECFIGLADTSQDGFFA